MPQKPTAADWAQSTPLTEAEFKSLKLAGPSPAPAPVERLDPIPGMPSPVRAGARDTPIPGMPAPVKGARPAPPPPEGSAAGRFVGSAADELGITPAKIGGTATGVLNMASSAVRNPWTLPLTVMGVVKENVVDPIREHGGALGRQLMASYINPAAPPDPDAIKGVPFVGPRMEAAYEQAEGGDLAGGLGRAAGAALSMPTVANAPGTAVRVASKLAKVPQVAATASPVTRYAFDSARKLGQAAERVTRAGTLPQVPDVGDLARPATTLAGDVVRGGVTNPIRASATRGAVKALNTDPETAAMILKENLLKGGVERGLSQVPGKLDEAEAAARGAGRHLEPGQQIGINADIDVIKRNREHAQVARNRGDTGTDYRAADTERYREGVASEIADPLARRVPEVEPHLTRMEDLQRAERTLKAAPETARRVLPPETGVIGAVPTIYRSVRPGMQQNKFNFANRTDRILQLTPSAIRAAVLAELLKSHEPGK